MLKGKKIIIGVTGSIAAYKTAYLVRNLVKLQAEVRVVSSPSASAFIGNVTLATLSKNSVYQNFTPQDGTNWNNHVELGLWADLMIIAPTTANTLAKMAHGICDNFLMAVYLSAKCPVAFAPAMDLDMFLHPSTQNNLNVVQSFGNILLDANEGELASGLKGKGRMKEPDEITQFVIDFFKPNTILKGKKVLITAGPTYESLDPVRYIGNHSSGKMGIALSEAFYQAGAEVYLVCGPSTIKTSAKIHRIDVTSALEMYAACMEHKENYAIAVLAAAVSDYRPQSYSNQKIKKTAENPTIELVKNPDILFSLGEIKKSHQILIGFAMETENLIANARKKLNHKNADCIVLNSLTEAGAGFKHNTNKVVLVENHQETDLPLQSKQQVALNIVSKSCELLNAKNYDT